MSDVTSRGADPGEFETPPGYSLWSAERKADWLWNGLIVPTRHKHSRLPPLQPPFMPSGLKGIGIVLRRRELVKALERSTDLMEPARPKVIHRHGSVAMIAFETCTDSPFTGLLAPPPDGGAIGLIRMSMVAKVTGRAAITPAFGLKLLIDGQPSADVLAMNHTVGQGRDFNMFSNSMTNDLSDEHLELRLPQRLMSKLFSRVSEQPRRLVATHLADQRPDGSRVGTPQEPRRLVFSPTSDAQRVFTGQAGVDFRRVLANLDAGTPLYDVDGVTGPAKSMERVRVGVIRTTTNFVSSDGGDRLFFRHVQA